MNDDSPVKIERVLSMPHELARMDRAKKVSAAIEQLLEALPLDAGIEYVSLQKGWDQPLGFRFHDKLDWNSVELCKDLYDTTQLIRSCDLVVTIGSLMSMLAPALGVPTWLLNTHNSAWQFGPNEAPVSWFRTPEVRFYQTEQGNWYTVLADLAKQLREWASR